MASHQSQTSSGRRTFIVVGLVAAGAALCLIPAGKGTHSPLGRVARKMADGIEEGVEDLTKVVQKFGNELIEKGREGATRMFRPIVFVLSFFKRLVQLHHVYLDFARALNSTVNLAVDEVAVDFYKMADKVATSLGMDTTKIKYKLEIYENYVKFNKSYIQQLKEHKEYDSQQFIDWFDEFFAMFGNPNTKKNPESGAGKMTTRRDFFSRIVTVHAAENHLTLQQQQFYEDYGRKLALKEFLEKLKDGEKFLNRDFWGMQLTLFSFMANMASPGKKAVDGFIYFLEHHTLAAKFVSLLIFGAVGAQPAVSETFRQQSLVFLNKLSKDLKTIDEILNNPGDSAGQTNNGPIAKGFYKPGSNETLAATANRLEVVINKSLNGIRKDADAAPRGEPHHLYPVGGFVGRNAEKSGAERETSHSLPDSLPPNGNIGASPAEDNTRRANTWPQSPEERQGGARSPIP